MNMDNDIIRQKRKIPSSIIVLMKYNIGLLIVTTQKKGIITFFKYPFIEKLTIFLRTTNAITCANDIVIRLIIKAHSGVAPNFNTKYAKGIARSIVRPPVT